MRRVRKFAIRKLPTGPQLRSASFGPQNTRWPVRGSAGPQITRGRLHIIIKLNEKRIFAFFCFPFYTWIRTKSLHFHFRTLYVVDFALRILFVPAETYVATESISGQSALVAAIRCEFAMFVFALVIALW